MKTSLGASLRPLFQVAFAFSAFALFILAAPICSAATTYYVSPSGSDTNPGTQAAPFKTIQQAINNAATGDTVSVAAGTYNGPGDVDLDAGGKSLTVTAPSGAANTTIDCGGNTTSNPQITHRAFYFHTNEAKSVVNGLTIENGNETGTGGAVDIESGSTVTLTNCTFTGNTGYPGIVYNAGKVTLTGCTATANTSTYDTVNDDVIFNDGGTAALTNCTISGNSGGGVYAGGTTVLTSCTITGNTGAYGGGVYVDSTATLSICVITNNIASDGGNGGGVYNQGTVTLNGCNVSSNAAGYGGGIYNGAYYGGVTLTGCVVNGNTASNSNGYTSSGGGIYNGGPMTLSECVLIGNTASNNGGGVDNQGASDGNGGPGLKLINCLLIGDVSSSGNGGGIDNESDATLLMQFSTLSANSTSASGTQGGALENDNTATLKDDILYANTAPYGSEIGIATSGNPVTTATYSDIQGGLNGTGNIHADPLFVNPSGGDYHLQTGSPCIGAGVAITGVTTDLDGKTRANPPTIGCYEGAEVVARVTHLLWSNTDGKAAFWNVAADGTITGVTGYGPYTDGSASALWMATALVTGPDGVSHLLWSNPDGHVALWNVTDSGSITGVAGFGPYTDGSPQNTWRASGVSVGSDNVMRLLWTNPDGKAALWSLDGSGNPSAVFGYGPYTDGSAQNVWSAVGVSVGS